MHRDVFGFDSGRSGDLLSGRDQDAREFTGTEEPDPLAKDLKRLMNGPAGTLRTSHRPAPVISNGRLGMMLLVGTETVLFACFISAYIILRKAAAVWPPAGTPHLTPVLASVNTAVLVLSSYILMTRKPSRHAIVFLMGCVFLLLQGVEFHRLYARGLTLQTGPYGSIFYSLVGLHGFHVIGGLGFLFYLLISIQNPTERKKFAETYWHFVTSVWLVLFSILYLI
jgi:cytochrome c oxidase subunit 3